MFHICPFATTIDDKGQWKTSSCHTSCALNVSGKCAFALMGALAKEKLTNDKVKSKD